MNDEEMELTEKTLTCWKGVDWYSVGIEDVVTVGHMLTARRKAVRKSSDVKIEYRAWMSCFICLLSLTLFGTLLGLPTGALLFSMAIMNIIMFVFYFLKKGVEEKHVAGVDAALESFIEKLSKRCPCEDSEGEEEEPRQVLNG